MSGTTIIAQNFISLMDRSFHAKPFLICSVYRPPRASSDWIEEELSNARTTGLELILMGDFNIDITHSMNNKCIHLIQIFGYHTACNFTYPCYTVFIDNNLSYLYKQSRKQY